MMIRTSLMGALAVMGALLAGGCQAAGAGGSGGSRAGELSGTWKVVEPGNLDADVRALEYIFLPGGVLVEKRIRQDGRTTRHGEYRVEGDQIVMGLPTEPNETRDAVLSRKQAAEKDLEQSLFMGRTEKHPSVIRTRRVIQQLDERIEALSKPDLRFEEGRYQFQDGWLILQRGDAKTVLRRELADENGTFKLSEAKRGGAATRTQWPVGVPAQAKLVGGGMFEELVFPADGLLYVVDVQSNATVMTVPVTADEAVEVDVDRLIGSILVARHGAKGVHMINEIGSGRAPTTQEADEPIRSQLFYIRKEDLKW